VRRPPAGPRGGLDLSADDALRQFAGAVGPSGPVTVIGGRTQWAVGGAPAGTARELRAPDGVVAFEPAELTVRVRTGTAVAELHGVLAAHGQTTVLPERPGGTVGGAVAVGRSGVRRLGDGPLRDAVLECRFVTAEGRLAKAGGPTVKNVSGYDLCRLLVGSLGTLGLFAEVVLRTRPLPPARRWVAGVADPFELLPRLYRPGAILWDGHTTWVLLEGHPDDVAAQAGIAAAAGLVETDGPPAIPAVGRLSVAPGELRSLGLEPGTFVAEVGVGLVHLAGPVPAGLRPPAQLESPVLEIQRRLKALFDPTGRLNPGRDLLGGAAA